MKHLKLLPLLLLSLIAAPAEAHHGDSCLDLSSHINVQERAAYLKACLASTSSPARVQEAALKNKSLRCTQNAKNLKLHGDERADYIRVCINKNEAAAKMAAIRTHSALALTAAPDSAHK